MNPFLLRAMCCILAWLACGLAWRAAPAATSAAYLAIWLFWVGTMLGGLANVWLHALTGGNWGNAIRPSLLRHAKGLPIAAVCFLPILFSLQALYPWAAHAGAGEAAWHARLSAPAFKLWWLSPVFFCLRSVAYLVIWFALAACSGSPSRACRQGFAAFALIVYGVTVSLASIDWIMSLMPLWYSSIFGMLVGTSQMFSGMALGILLASRPANAIESPALRDLGNLLLMYVLLWAYLSFVQFLIIWAENLPLEIAWYLPRGSDDWLWLAQLLALLLFAVPLGTLLSARAKQSPMVMRCLAALILVTLPGYFWWLVFPSLPAPPYGWLPAMIAPTFAIGITAWLAHDRRPRSGRACMEARRG